MPPLSSLGLIFPDSILRRTDWLMVEKSVSTLWLVLAEHSMNSKPFFYAKAAPSSVLTCRLIGDMGTD